MFDEEEEALYQRLVESCSGGSYNTVSDTGSDVDDIKDPIQEKTSLCETSLCETSLCETSLCDKLYYCIFGKK
jgi:hypothetical protein